MSEYEELLHHLVAWDEEKVEQPENRRIEREVEGKLSTLSDQTISVLYDAVSDNIHALLFDSH